MRLADGPPLPPDPRREFAQRYPGIPYPPTPDELFWHKANPNADPDKQWYWNAWFALTELQRYQLSDLARQLEAHAASFSPPLDPNSPYQPLPDAARQDQQRQDALIWGRLDAILKNL